MKIQGRMPCEEGGGNHGEASTVLAPYDDTTINAGSRWPANYQSLGEKHGTDPFSQPQNAPILLTP